MKDDSNNSNQRKRIREDLTEETYEFGIPTKYSKRERKNSYYSQNENFYEESMNITNNANISSNIQNKLSEDKYQSEWYEFMTKNDTLNLIWKTTVSQNDFFNLNEDKKITSIYNSKRNDIWRFTLSHHFSARQTSNPGVLSLAIGCHRNTDFNGKTNRTNKINDEVIRQIFESLNFQIDLTINIINYKTSNFCVKNLTYNTLETKEFNLGSDFYRGGRENQIVIVVEMAITKNLQSIANLERRKLGYIGIVNEAATCYMNSMLQTLNIFGSFKKAVFQIPTNNDDYNSVALSLQRLFYDLMKDHNPVSTGKLVKSFGWSREHILIQHDVQEFNILLADLLEKKMKGTSSEGTFSKLFEGKLINYIKCIQVDYSSNKEEKFTDLQLTVKGCKNIYESLKLFTEEETLDKEDKYDAGEHGKQAALKGIKFIRFPNIIIMQLKRFEYNPKKEIMVKINDSFEFNETLDLNPYIYKNDQNQEDEDNTYSLHSVVVHQGSANSGHYYAYIRPTIDDFWIQFNDEIVRPADKYEVFDNNFGGNYKTYKMKNKGEIISNLNYFEFNAYILVYIRNSMRKDILSPFDDNQIYLELKERFEKEKMDEKKIQNKKFRLKDNLNLLLITNETILNHNNKVGIADSFSDFASCSPMFMNRKSRMVINFPKNAPIEKLLEFISSETNIPMYMMKLYQYEWDDPNYNILKRNDFELISLDENELKKNAISLTHNYKKNILVFYLYIADPRYKVLEFNSSMKEDYSLQDEPDKYIHIPNTMNQVTFFKNSNTFEKIENSIEHLYPIANKNLKIFFLKEFLGVGEIKFISEVKITKIAHLDFDLLNHSSYLDNFISENFTKQQVNFLIEKTCLKDVLAEQNENYYKMFTIENIRLILSKINGLILIPLTHDEVIDKLAELYESIYLDIFLISTQKKSDYIIEKMKINAIKTDENGIKKLILEYVKNLGMFSRIIETEDHYYIDSDKKIYRVGPKYLTDHVHSDQIDFIMERDSSNKFVQAVKEYPVLKFYNRTSSRLDITINLYNKNILSEFNYHEFHLYNRENNKIGFISCVIPKKMRKCKEVIDYIYDNILNNKKVVKTDTIYSKENYYFILQNPKHVFIYQIFNDKTSDLFKFEGKCEINYRLQPLDNQTISLLSDQENLKLFISIAHDSTYIDPIVIYLKRKNRIYDMKFQILEELKKIKKLQGLFSQKPSNTNTTDPFRYFASKIEDGKIVRGNNLQIYKEDEMVDNIFSDKAFNLLVEINKTK